MEDWGVWTVIVTAIVFFVVCGYEWLIIDVVAWAWTRWTDRKEKDDQGQTPS